MAMIDVSQVNALAQKLAAAPLKKHALVAAAVKKGAQNIKEAIQEDVRSSSNPGFRRIPIHYDMKSEGVRIEADIGPEEGGAGSLANIAFFGTSRGGGGHEFYGHGADELDPTAQHVAKAAEGL
ncbi:hypothetical protein [Bifidobacterium mongoliense]|uniref:HK97 gp10 family phage protein n=1 Tax=Bifidobacterium mongoliense TaxID=518643 RepID=A0A423UE13_9BIFI|nr:hypothetical protein [Bifidobacterium mongoliense]ROT86940.1 hypothetical protein BMONG18_0939 [Bifidobacterium mongoliense]